MHKQTPYNTSKRAEYAQNYLKNPSLGNKLVEQAGFIPSDTVIEIGVGRGVLTIPLAETGATIIGLDTDQDNIDALTPVSSAHSNVTLYNQDALAYRVDTDSYHLFANIPFNITSQIIKKYCLKKPFPLSVHLFMQKEAAERFIGEKKSNVVSVLLNTLYTLSITHRFKKTDYTPSPSVDSVLVSMKLKSTSQEILDNWGIYKDFVTYGFTEPVKPISKKFRDKITAHQLEMFHKKTGINPTTTHPLLLTVTQWQQLFIASLSK